MANLTITAMTYDIPCQSFACTERAKWQISAHPEDLINALFLCDECADSLFTSMLESPVAKRVLGKLAASVRGEPPKPQNAPVSDVPKAPAAPEKPKSAAPKAKKTPARPKAKGSGAKSAGRGRSGAAPASKRT